MQANEFEKQVQKQLEEFQLSPSASVWKKVEVEIREKKRRRFIFFFILPLAFGLIVFSFYKFVNTAGKTAPSGHAIASKKNNSLTTDTNTTIDAETIKPTINSQPEEIDQPGVSGKEKTSQELQPRIVKDNNQELSTSTPLVPDIKNRTTGRNNRKANNIENKQNNLRPVADNVQPKPPINTVVNVPAINTDTKKDNTIPIPQKAIQTDQKPIADTDIAAVKKDNIQNDDAVAVDAQQEEKVTKKKQQPGIKWGIDLSGGMTTNRNNAFSLEKSSVADMMNSPATGSVGTPTAIIPSSPVRSGPAFSAGIAGEMQLSERSRLSTGLRYSYASNRIKTGTRTDTLLRLQSNYSSVQVDRVYRGLQKNNYTNSYHFLTIPVWYHWQVNKGTKLPIQWNLGLTASYLIASNALVYEASYGGIYYRNKDAFTRMHFNLGTGVSIRLGEKNKMEWVIGPELNFDMSRLIKENKKQYLLYGGINLKLFLPKKKK